MRLSCKQLFDSMKRNRIEQYEFESGEKSLKTAPDANDMINRFGLVYYDVFIYILSKLPSNEVLKLCKLNRRFNDYCKRNKMAVIRAIAPDFDETHYDVQTLDPVNFAIAETVSRSPETNFLIATKVDWDDENASDSDMESDLYDEIMANFIVPHGLNEPIGYFKIKFEVPQAAIMYFSMQGTIIGFIESIWEEIGTEYFPETWTQQDEFYVTDETPQDGEENQEENAWLYGVTEIYDESTHTFVLRAGKVEKFNTYFSTQNEPDMEIQKGIELNLDGSENVLLNQRIERYTHLITRRLVYELLESGTVTINSNLKSDFTSYKTPTKRSNDFIDLTSKMSIGSSCSNCNSSAISLKCGGCKTHAYCGQKCAVSHWKNGHSTNCTL